MRSFFGAVVALCVSGVSGLPKTGFGRLLMRFEPRPGKEEVSQQQQQQQQQQQHSASKAALYEYYVTQRLDHFDGANPATFQQRFFVNSSFWDGSGPVFLCVGGEGPALDESVLYASAHCNDMTELGVKIGALMFALEHRYYGNSIPAASRQYLSSQQAVADIAAFVEHANEVYSLDNKNKWTTWGGSYPGMVAGFARLKLPHLIHASSSSSSPWKAQVDMPEYNDLVGNALSLASVGGSPECRDIVEQGHDLIGELFASNQSNVVAEKFNFCDPKELATKSAQKNFAGYGVISVDAQDNDPANTRPAGNIASICASLLAADGDDVDKLAAVSKIQYGDRCLAMVTDDALLAEFQQDIALSDSLSWPYQTCTQFGFYQTCEVGSRCPWTKGYVTLQDEISLCQSAFNIPADQVYDNVKFSNSFYGADQPMPSRIFFANGDVDP